MRAITSIDLRDNFKSYCEQVVSGETLVVRRPNNQNIVVLSEKEYNDMLKSLKRVEYLNKLDRGTEDIAQGCLITKTLAELREMEKE